MKQVKFCLLGVTALFSTMLSFAQTAEEIVAKHIEAIGGKEKINSIKSIYTESTLSVMGNEAPSKSYLLNGKGFKNEVDFQGQQIVQVYTDQGGWAINPMAGSTEPVAMPEQQFKSGKSQINVGGPLFDSQAKGQKVELAGKEGNLFKLKLNIDGTDMFFLIDPATWYITKQIVKGEVGGQQVEITTSFTNYKKTDFGFVLPYTAEMDFGGFAMSTNINKVEVNKEIDPKIFDMPAK